MDPIEIGLWVSGGMLLMVVLGMRVAFAAAMAGLIGLIWIFWAKKGMEWDQLGWALTVAIKTAGQVPHSKVSSQALSLIPTFILIGDEGDELGRIEGYPGEDFFWSLLEAMLIDKTEFDRAIVETPAPAAKVRP